MEKKKQNMFIGKYDLKDKKFTIEQKTYKISERKKRIGNKPKYYINGLKPFEYISSLYPIENNTYRMEYKRTYYTVELVEHSILIDKE